MGTITFGGLASGLDTEEIISGSVLVTGHPPPEGEGKVLALNVAVTVKSPVTPPERSGRRAQPRDLEVSIAIARSK